MSPPLLKPHQIYEFDSKGMKDTFGLLNSYDLEILIPGLARIFMGRFSSSLLSKIRLLPRRGQECSVSIGAFCEAGEAVSLLVGGEHPNSSIFNFTFGASCEFFRFFTEETGLQRAILPSNNLMIGDNVLLSNHSHVFDGAQIGQGSIIAAGAVVVSECKEHSVYGGVPARYIKKRFNNQQCEDYERLNLPFIRAHCLAKLPTLMATLDTGKCTLEEVLAEVEHMPKRPKITVTGGINNQGVIGIGEIISYSVGDAQITDENSIRQLNDYFKQFYKSDEKIRWCADIFHALGLS